MPQTQSRRPQGARSGGARPSNNRRSFSGGGGGGRRPSNGGRGGGRSGGGARKMPTFDPSQFINKNPVEVVEEVYVPKNKFSDFGFHPDIVKNLDTMGLTDPSPIQDEVIPQIMQDVDVIGIAATGTGKTAAFLLPLIQKTLELQHEQTLILTPTRELALQVENEFKKFKTPFKLSSTTCVGGTNIRPQLSALRRKQHFIIGTPGRVMDLIDRGAITPANFTNVVLDEADRMLDMGFIHDMRKILGDIPEDRQTLFFSATMTKEAEGLVNDFMIDPITISVKKKDVTDSVKQDVVVYQQAHKFDTLLALLSKEEFKRVIIFGAMKHSVEKLAQDLTKAGVKADAIHGNKSHGQRQRALNGFKSGQVQVLTATDVAARGIHVDNVSHVINYDLPGTFEDYVHRIGRTGRGVEKGEALTFVSK
jgi:ATP-dependent RNA helicase RhlE